MEITADLFTWGVSSIVSAGVCFGVIRTTLRNTVTYEKHREMCAKERAETNAALEKLFVAQKESYGMIKEIHGYMKAQNRGTL